MCCRFRPRFPSAFSRNTPPGAPTHWFRQRRLQHRRRVRRPRRDHGRALEPGTAAEVQQIKTLAGGARRPIEVFLQNDVSESRVKALFREKSASPYPLIHFACHGYFNESDPMKSGIVLSEVSNPSDEDGYLTIPEIVLLNFNSRMIVVSACETGLGEVKRGAGMVGIARAFLVAGTESLGVSLWKIDDTATSIFMENVYKKVLNEGKAFKTAYYEVKNEFRHGKYGENYTRPTYWAAFVLYE
jgi:CHAT domain-containing protein